MNHPQNEIIQKGSYKLGQKAKSNGMAEQPTGDPEFMYYLKFNSTPGLPEMPGEMMESWLNGWEEQ